MKCAEVGILEEMCEIVFRRLLQCLNRGCLIAKIVFVVLRNLANQASKWQLANKNLRALLIASDLPECHRAWSEAMWLLHLTLRRFVYTFASA